MILADFIVSVEDPRRDVRVIVYDSVKGLRIAASRYTNSDRPLGDLVRQTVNGMNQRGVFAE